MFEDDSPNPTAFQWTFTKYSCLELTRWKDKPSAIAGLETRLEMAYGSIIVYGVLQCFLGQSLLWHRGGNEWIEPIEELNQKVPSWSWMLYGGMIDYCAFLPTCFQTRNDDVVFNFHESGSEACVLEAPLARFSESCRVDCDCMSGINCAYLDCFDRNNPNRDKKCTIKNTDGHEIGWIIYDRKVGHIECHRCIAVARGTASLGGGDALLVISPTCVVGKDPRTYRRIGVAFIKDGHLSTIARKVRVI
jgi:hypothetical protein